jgi:hypothetical protein
MKEDELRKEFERIAGGPPFDRPIERFPDDAQRYAWPGDYRDIHVSLAFEIAKDIAAWADRRAREGCADICASLATVNHDAYECAQAINDSMKEPS